MKLDRITAEILPENRAHRHAGTRPICQELDFRLDYSAEDRTMKAAIDL